MVEMNADIYALNEIENEFGGDQNGDGVFAIDELVKALNTAYGNDVYDFVDPGVPFVGTDAIANAYVYRTSRVELVNDAALLNSSVDPIFLDNKNRPAVAQSFQLRNWDGRGEGDCITLAVNHLKSKEIPIPFLTMVPPVATLSEPMRHGPW